jgi:hypothetical protein
MYRFNPSKLTSSGGDTSKSILNESKKRGSLITLVDCPTVPLMDIRINSLEI